MEQRNITEHDERTREEYDMGYHMKLQYVIGCDVVYYHILCYPIINHTTIYFYILRYAML